MGDHVMTTTVSAGPVLRALLVRADGTRRELGVIAVSVAGVPVPPNVELQVIGLEPLPEDEEPS